MMYERQIINNVTEGSNILPSVLRFNNEPHSNLTREKKTLITSLTQGNIGNGYNEFIAEFPEYRTTKVNDAYAIIYGDIFSSISKKILIDNFYIFAFDDYSCQSMTMQHYDYFAKVFYDNSKVHSSATFLIKSFTMKKAWVFVDKTIDSDATIEKFKIIIDFIYATQIGDKYDKTETSYKYKLHYTEANNYSNLQNLFGNNVDNVRSPYFDINYIPSDISEYSVLSQQNQAYKYRIYHNTNKNLSDDMLTAYTDVKNEHQVTTTFDENVNKIQYFDTLSSTNDYKASLNFECYKFDYLTDETNKTVITNGKTDKEIKINLLGNRAFINFDYENNTHHYEVYPTLIDNIHYIFRYGGTQPNNDNVRKFMKSEKIYLYNAPFTNINYFTESLLNYVEVYIPFPYYRGPMVENIDDYSESDKTTFELQTLSDFSDESHTDFTTLDKRSYYDPTFTNQTYDDMEYPKPYFNKDQYVTGLFDESNPSVVIDWKDDDISVQDAQKGLPEDTLFDIGSSSVSFNNDYWTDITLDADEIIQNFKDNGFDRDEDEENLSDNEKSFIAYEDAERTLCKNLEKFLTNAELNDNYDTEAKSIDELDFSSADKPFFIYFKYHNKSISLTVEYTNKAKIDINYYTYENTTDKDPGYKYKFIIPIYADICKIKINEKLNGSVIKKY